MPEELTGSSVNGNSIELYEELNRCKKEVIKLSGSIDTGSLIELYEKVISCKKDAIKEIKSLEEEVKKHHDSYNSNKKWSFLMNGVGSTLAFLTCGAALIAGTAFVTLSSINDLHTSYSDNCKTKEIIERLERIAEKEEEHERNLETALRELQEKALDLCEKHNSSLNGASIVVTAANMNVTVLGGTFLAIKGKLASRILPLNSIVKGLGKMSGTQIIKNLSVFLAFAATIYDATQWYRNKNSKHPTMEMMMDLKKQIRADIRNLRNEQESFRL